MRWIAVLLIWFATMICACNPTEVDNGVGWSESESDGVDTTTTTINDTTGSATDDLPGGPIEQPPAQLSCDQVGGICVTVAPATYTGPSLFWIGTPKAMPGCPDRAPYPGLGGFVKNVMFLWFVNECLVTPSDLCLDEGKTCVPAPPEDFQICIHHDDDSPCMGDYSEKRAISELESGMAVTLCCQPHEPPG
jgi:hypothetical protein